MRSGSLGTLEACHYFFGVESGSDSDPWEGIWGVAPVLPSRAVPKQGAQQKVG